MESILKYTQKNRKRMLDIFKSLGKHDKIQATKVFNYIQNSFDKSQIRFEVKGKDFFDDDDNSTEMEKLLESYYRIHENDGSKKFYLYRIQFTFDQILDILSFWLERDPSVKIVTTEEQMANSQKAIAGQSKINENMEKLLDKQQNQKVSEQNEEQQNNEFDVNDENLPQLIAECQQKIQQQQRQLESAQDEQEKQKIISSIKQLKMKIKVLQQRIKANSLQKPKKKQINTVEPMEQSVRTESPSNKSMKKITINYKAIFEFYAKQTHLTGVKATFERIEHQSQRINYQKLVHFLREYNLLPSDVASRKKVHGLYIKHSEATRDLKLEGFLNVLDGVVDILSPNKSKQERQQILKMKIYEKDTKNSKILNHPFHSLEKQDFRINVNELNYSFKLKPQDGKFVHEVNNSIEKRRQDKLEAKTERSKQKELKEIRYLKKLQSIDPFSQLLLKNSKILQQKTQQCEPIASLENIEKYRDSSFDFEGHFGIDLTQINNGSPKKNAHVEIKRQYSERYKRGEDTQKRVEKLQKDEASKMENLMSGIIERSNAKMQKMGISPNKLEKSVRFA